MKLWDADTPDEKVETDAGVESCENPKSRFEINRDIPSETERNQSNFSASGKALKRCHEKVSVPTIEKVSVPTIVEFASTLSCPCLFSATWREDSVVWKGG